MRLPTLLAAASLLLAGGIATELFAAQCMQAGGENEIAEGRLSVGHFEDAAGRPETAYIVTLPADTCLTGEEENDQIDSAKTIHIFGSSDAVHATIDKFVGQDVMVRGMPFGAMTVHHHAPIVMDITEIDGL